MADKAEHIGAGFVLETWAEDISDPDTCIDILCNSQNEYQFVGITNERPSKMTAICEGDDTNDCLEFKIGNKFSDKWEKPYKNIFPSSHPANSVVDRGAKIKVNNVNNYSETIITLLMKPSWENIGGAPRTLAKDPEAAFKVTLR